MHFFALIRDKVYICKCQFMDKIVIKINMIFYHNLIPIFYLKITTYLHDTRACFLISMLRYFLRATPTILLQ